MSVKRVVPDENLLSDDEFKKPVKIKKKVRNYSFRSSKRLPENKMTLVNEIKIPSMPGSCYHAIMVTLAENKDKFCNWDKIIESTKQNMHKYGGTQAWEKFIQKNDVKSYQQRIKDNTHTLTRTGRDCYGYRLHEQGMCIYYFKDGAILITGGTFKQKGDKYDVVFSDGRGLQTRYRGTTMTYKEYKRFLEKGLIDKNGCILDHRGIKDIRSKNNSSDIQVLEIVNVCIELKDTFDQNTAYRLEKLGLQVEQALGNELIGMIHKSHLDKLKADPDIKQLEISGE